MQIMNLIKCILLDIIKQSSLKLHNILEYLACLHLPNPARHVPPPLTRWAFIANLTLPDPTPSPQACFTLPNPVQGMFLLIFPNQPPVILTIRAIIAKPT